jgi:Tol biopolymer transport system component
MASGSEQKLEKTRGANLPFWSPDGQQIGFFAEQMIKIVTVSSGVTQTILEGLPLTEAAGGNGATWNRDGSIVYSPGLRGPLMRIAASGGAPSAVTALDAGRGETGHSWPQFLPDGRHLLYFARSSDPTKSGIYVQEIGSSSRVLALANRSRGAFALPDYLLFTREQTLYARHLNLKTFLVEGEPKAVAEEVTENEDLGRAAFSAPAAGVLVYRAGTFIGKTRFTWRGGDGKLLGTVGEPAEYLSAGLSPDEKYSAFIIQRGGRFGGIDKVWIMDMASGALTPTSLNGRSAVVWSPDSLRLAVGGPNGLLELTLATGVASVVSKELSWVTDWFQDGLIAGDASAVYLIPATGDRKPQTVLRPKFRVFNVRVSPDGTRVAYVSNEAGINEVYIAAYPGFTEQRRVSTAGGSSPVWRKNGRVLFFLTPGTESRMMAAEVRGGERIEVGTPAELFRVSTGGFGRDLFSVARDGRFLIREGLASERDRPYIVIVNWTSELKQ